MVEWEKYLNKDAFWIWLIVLSTIFAYGLTITGLSYGITQALPHLLYIPVVITSYLYPRRGLYFALAIGVSYAVIAAVMTGFGVMTTLEAAARAGVIILIGAIIALLSFRAREREVLYKGLFDHSEAGAILIEGQLSDLSIVDMNETALRLTGRNREHTLYRPLKDLFEAPDEYERFCRAVSSHEGVDTFETVLKKGNTKVIVLISAGKVSGDRMIMTFADITARRNAESALSIANDKLNLLSAVAVDHLHETVDSILDVVDETGRMKEPEPLQQVLGKIRVLAYTISRQLFLMESYRDLGTNPPVWHTIQNCCRRIFTTHPDTRVRFEFFVERVELYGDQLLPEVILHLLENSIRHGGKISRVTVTCRIRPEGADLILEDDGDGIAQEVKESIFEYDSGKHSGIGLFICRQILEVTGMTIRETGSRGKGARFIIHVPEGMFRVAVKKSGEDLIKSPPAPPSIGVSVRELVPAEFHFADELWVPYHQMTGDPETDRIFMVFASGAPVSAARVRRSEDGLEMEGVYTPDTLRGHGYARIVCEALVSAHRYEELYMFAVANLVGFYGSLGFYAIPETGLPPSIRKRYAWAGGNMEGAMVCPMKRDADPLQSAK